MRTHSSPQLAVSIGEAAHMLGLGRTTIYKLITEGQIEVVKIGRRTLCKAASLSRLIDGV
jgi:excisionase family DNA binding protein